MKTMISRVSLFAVAAALLIVPAGAQRQYKVMEWKGKDMPKFEMTDLNGKKHTNQSLRGKVIVLDFWATWCGPCKAASPTVQKMHDEWKDKDVVVIGANTWERGADRKPQTDGSNARAYMAQHNYTYPVTINNDELAKTLQIEGVPTFMVIDQQGKVVEVTVGFNERAIRAAVDRLIK